VVKNNRTIATMILIIDNYDSFTWNLVQRIAELSAALQTKVIRNDEIAPADIAHLNPSHIILSPGPCTPSEAGICNDVVTHYRGKIPILGVCLGHQCIGQVFGGRIVRAPRIMHGKTSKIFHDERGIYAGVENPFVATRYHSLVIAPDSMPEALEITAKTWEDEIMGVRAKHLAVPLEGVQFHPESIMTVAGKALLANFLQQAREVSRKGAA
jgi:anthranilate synthase/aminodeoxychorismate synthase-like glutamine amidotransferase